MRPLLLSTLIILSACMTALAQNEKSSSPELIAMADNPATAPLASYVQGELEVIPIKSNIESSIKVSAFPNPIKHNITLLTFGAKEANLTYKLTKGNITLAEQAIKNSKESINLDSYDEDKYILTVLSASRAIKSFRILKH